MKRNMGSSNGIDNFVQIFAGWSMSGVCWWGVVLALWDRQRELGFALHSIFLPIVSYIWFLEMNYSLELLNYDFRWRLHSSVWLAFLPIRALASPILPGCHHESCGATAGMIGHLLLNKFSSSLQNDQSVIVVPVVTDISGTLKYP